MELARCLVFAFISFVIPIIIATTALVQRYQETAKDAMRLATATTWCLCASPITVATFLLPDDLMNYQNFLRGQPIDVSCKIVGIRGRAFLEESYQVFLHVNP